MSEGIEAPLAGHAHDARLATLYALRARAYRALGQDGAGDAAQRLAAEWGAFAYGANHPGLARALAP
ncbi:hypothetical protein H0I76_00370 [Limibaculum sp. M0105]|uniref:Uncharacterized protein n=1 Tax=Thermohalobaculum xanthum TaxID=2753746 RepID=A0A8J7M3J1_9RHOB|nr:hypothetical protein [Thermohalobaculum xanthum]MBK0397630.1 hypothetical protein [Thermohalobaculum xanthum]